MVEWVPKSVGGKAHDVLRNANRDWLALRPVDDRVARDHMSPEVSSPSGTAQEQDVRLVEGDDRGVEAVEQLRAAFGVALL